MTLDWITPEDAARKWGVKVRQVQALCVDGRIEGAVRFGHAWAIPKDAPRPLDGRTKSAKSALNTAIGAESIIGVVNGTMAIEGMPLTDEDKARLRAVLHNEVSADEMVRQLVSKHRRTANAGRV